MEQPVLFNPSCTRIGTAAASRSQETRSLPRVSRTWDDIKEQKGKRGEANLFPEESKKRMNRVSF